MLLSSAAGAARAPGKSGQFKSIVREPADEPPAIYFSQHRPRLRPSLHAAVPGRGAAHGGAVRSALGRAAGAFDSRLRRLRRRRHTGGLARRPLEPLGHDGDIFCRHRHLLDPHRARPHGIRNCRRPVFYRPLRLDLSPGRHLDGGAGAGQGRAAARHQRRVGQYGHRGGGVRGGCPQRMDFVARCFLPARGR